MISPIELAEWAKEIKNLKNIQTVIRIPGDASSRLYYRITTPVSSYIVMKTDSFESLGARYPFLTLQKHFLSSGVDVPAVLNFDPRKGLILLEDLGDVTLLKKLQKVSDTEVERHLYECAIDALVHLQVYASPPRKPSEIDAYRLAFDHEKLLGEINFTIKQFYEDYLKRKIKSQDRRILSQGFGEICERLSREPRVLTHRDYHSRNIMILPFRSRTQTRVHRDRFVLIDFQDARMGPPHYDLASLLKDSYYQLEESQVDRLIDYYTSRWEAETDEAIDRIRFREVFDHMSIQRNFKAIGSFASFMNIRQDSSYLKYIGNTFENIRRTLLKYPRHSKLREVLYHYYYF